MNRLIGYLKILRTLPHRHREFLIAYSLVELWTIGHSNRTLEQFLELLTGQQIELLADVRRFPGSRRQPHFNSENLPKSLMQSGIDYTHFPELGGRRKALPNSPNTVWRNEAFRGYADFMMTPEFHMGIDRLLKLAHAKRTAIMCAEALWWQCHRSLIADYLKASDHTIMHIMGSGKIEEHPFTSAARILDGKLTYGIGDEPQFLF